MWTRRVEVRGWLHLAPVQPRCRLCDTVQISHHPSPRTDRAAIRPTSSTTDIPDPSGSRSGITRT